MPAVTDLVVVDDLGPMFDGIPRLLGYGGVAALTPKRTNRGEVIVDADGRPRLILPTTVRGYYYDDLEWGSWSFAPKPDYVLLRADRDGKPLPGWLPETVLEWQRSRPGSGNRTSGADRRGGRRPTSSG